ncbi:hypothetical protein SARC_12697 [Sphaeroforma arctica JP610]|uniref:Uncharacterized protein n=1 Tax=Sphaeroforma arctica JP610 TaxID=667725 RepID=A0A0L0FFE5_9EUKA|nr:hypothetical protein SARC_12697 [Sphaeroforma arctica JP610]KNC74763.1 hypothetical protein SARC_12697 [Sphaeroforma arctica JP610]|eukprot:XP_014148665.1 hypothetical protein SARC_12697 [Sphaeroforma arctica JP610]
MAAVKRWAIVCVARRWRAFGCVSLGQPEGAGSYVVMRRSANGKKVLSEDYQVLLKRVLPLKTSRDAFVGLPDYNPPKLKHHKCASLKD